MSSANATDTSDGPQLDPPPAAKKRKVGNGNGNGTTTKPPPDPLSTTKRLQVGAGSKVTKISKKYEFLVEIDHVSSFRRLTDTAANVTNKITFEVVGAKTATDFQGIRFQSVINGGQQFIITSHSLLVPQIADEATYCSVFAVDILAFANLIKMINVNHVTTIYRLKGDDKVTIECWDAITKKKLLLTLALLAETEPKEENIANVTFDYTVEFALDDLDRILHHIQTLKATSMGFQFFKRGGDQHLTIKIVAEADNSSYAESFHVSVGGAGGGGTPGVYKVANQVTGKFLMGDDDAGENTDEKPEPDTDDTTTTKPHLSLYFQLKSIVNFLRSLEKSTTISMSFVRDYGICLQYHSTSNLSTSDDFIHFLVGVIDDSSAVTAAAT